MTRPNPRRASRIALLFVVSSLMAVAWAELPAPVVQPIPAAAPESAIGLVLQSIDAPATAVVASAPIGAPRTNGLAKWLVVAVPSRAPDIEAAHRLAPSAVLLADRMHGTDDDPTFDNDRREAIYGAIVASPGRYIAELAAVTEIPQSTVRYHLRVLEDDGLIRTALIRGKRRCFPSATDRARIAVEAALDDDSTAPILEAVARLEPVNVSALAEAVDAAPSTVSYHLDRLAADDLVHRERAGQTVITRLDPEVRTYLHDSGGVGDVEGG